jgi:phenylacetate-CoA ligase
MGSEVVPPASTSPSGSYDDATIVFLKHLVERLRAHSPFYSQRLASASADGWATMEQFAERIPRTIPGDLAEDPYQFLVTGDLSKVKIVVSSSGTTGAPKTVLHSSFYPHIKARQCHYFGLRPGSNVAVVGRFGSLSYILPMGTYRNLGFSVIGLGLKYDAEFCCRLIRQFGINVIRSVPSFVMYLCNEVSRLGLDGRSLGVTHAIVSNHAVSQREKRFIEEVLGAQVYSIYGSNEAGPIGFSCLCGEGYHIHTDRVVVEVADPTTGKRAVDGSVGNIVLTPLDNDVMPLLRYEVGDLGYFVPGRCECGEPWPRLVILGRHTDLFCIGRMGLRIFLKEIHDILSDIPGLVGSSQVVLDGSIGRERITIRVEAEGHSNRHHEMGSLVSQRFLGLRSHLEEDARTGAITVEVELVPPGSLPLTSEGKPKDRILDRRQ